MALDIITAEDGKTFMKGESVIGKVIYLGVNDSIDNYTQVNDEDLPKGEVKDEETPELIETIEQVKINIMLSSITI